MKNENTICPVIYLKIMYPIGFLKKDGSKIREKSNKGRHCGFVSLFYAKID
ncbi:hypothetical protein KZZ20_00115 [Methylacidiphilum fumariolicum]|uniref:hypothetical protein n=1 Tax=Candidatus Methylacidiphilum fumarolicum TaxID=591154 RepID=UPI000306A4C3|nr:hypothetical protein [Candidatus Methylacidiphilum fumarolicum]MBW6413936.1 hypothetical protein [Candidatus Methylacidiphilum fumarolicum]